MVLGTGSHRPAPAASQDTGQAPNSWQAMGVAGAPSPRSWGTAAWTGRQVLIWGGYQGETPLSGSATYCPPVSQAMP